MTKNYPYRLLTPGPVPLHPEVRKILAEPMLHHRTPEFKRVLKNVSEKLKDVFETKQPVFMHTSTGTGAMESAIVNTLSPGDDVLVVVSGKFGERWADMVKQFGLNVHPLLVEWGNAVDPQEIEKQLALHPTIKAVFSQYCETSTATVHPIRDIASIVRKRSETLLIVDAITAVGAMELKMDEWGLDVVIGGSQKAFMLPTGLSFIALSEKAWGFNQKSRLPKYYWDLRTEKKSLEKGETHFSSAVATIRALEISLQFLTGEQKTQTLARIKKLAKATREMSKPLGLQIYSKFPSASVTALLTPGEIDSQKLREHIEKEYNLTLMGGQDQLKGKILRIGHLGYITDDDMAATTEILYLALKDLGVPLAANAREEALAALRAELK